MKSIIYVEIGQNNDLWGCYLIGFSCVKLLSSDCLVALVIFMDGKGVNKADSCRSCKFEVNIRVHGSILTSAYKKWTFNDFQVEDT